MPEPSPQDVWGRMVQEMDRLGPQAWKEKEVDRRLSRTIGPPGPVLDVGCFFPVDTMEFARRGCRAVALDRSFDVLRKAREVVRAEGLLQTAHFVAGEAQHLPFRSASFTYVCDFSTIDHIPTHQERLSALAEYRRVKKPEGELVILTANKLQPVSLRHRFLQWRLGHHPKWGFVYFFFPWELRRYLRSVGFTVLEYDASMLWVPLYVHRIENLLDRFLERCARRWPAVRLIGFRFGFRAR